jgi:hypothetical protein
MEEVVRQLTNKRRSNYTSIGDRFSPKEGHEQNANSKRKGKAS